MDSDIDMGVIAEYLYDSRGQAALTPFEDDLMIGLRFAWNNVQSSELLAGVISCGALIATFVLLLFFHSEVLKSAILEQSAK